jgi:hypothetical protein
MGLFGSKPIGTPAPIVAPKIDVGLAQYRASDISAFEQQAAEVAESANQALTEQATKLASATRSMSLFQILGIILVIALLVIGCIIAYDNYAVTKGWTTVLFTGTPPLASGSDNLGTCDSSDNSQNVLASPSVASKTLNYVSGSDSSADLLGSPHNAESAVTIRGSNAPLSAQNEGSYGMQWWMFIKDWNYGFGKDKSILSRPDPTNTAIKNPSISLHPTENTLRVSVSIFPAGQEGSVSEPAPAGSSGTTDDVFVCEVADVPLQKWFAVSVTVFARNLDIYIDGKLVKSCFLPGVPKPASGDISVTPDGGFSGKMCSMFHYPRMLTPDDAIKFSSAGTTCKSDVDTTPAGSAAAAATGYAVKFGMYDTQGNTVREFAF